MSNDIHTAATAQLLKLAFASGACACEEGGGFEFRVTLRSGAILEGAPDADSAEVVGRVLCLLSGAYVLTHEIAAIEVVTLS